MATLYTNNAITTLNGAVTNVATSITVTDGSVFPNPTGGDYFWLTLADSFNVEIVQCTARSGNTLTVVRGQDGTTGTAFADGDQAQLRVTAIGLNEFAQSAALNTSNWDTAFGWGDHSAAGYADGTNEANWDTAFGWGDHGAAGYASSSHTHSTSDITSGTFANARISSGNVTQHQASLSIAFSQITGTVDADSLGGVTAASFLRSNATDSASGALTFSGGLNLSNGPGTIAGVTFDNGWLRVGSSSGGVSFDSNEIAIAGSLSMYALSGSTLTIHDGSGTLNITDAAMSSCTGNISQWTNDSGYALTSAIPTNNNQLTNGAGYITNADGGNAATLDSIDSTQFLRSDAADAKTSGTLTMNDNVILGIGTGNDLEIFHNGSDSYIDVNNNDILHIRDTTSSVILIYPSQSYVRFQDNIRLDLGSANDFRIYHNGTHNYMDMYTGNLYIRDSATTRFTFDDGGDFTATGNVTAYSDVRLKTNITPHHTALDAVLALDLVRYDRTDITRHEFGFIAQDVQKVAPEVVLKGEDGILSLDYAKLSALYAAAIQKLEARIRALEAK